MKKIILITLVLLFVVSVYSLPGSVSSVKPMRIYVSDPEIDNYYFGYLGVNIEKLGSHNYLFTPTVDDFSTVPFEKYISTITVAHSRCIMLSKTDREIEVISAYDIDVPTETWIHVGISKGHAIMCRDNLISELGDMNVEVYSGAISFNTNLIGVCEFYDIDLVSVSQSGMSDRYNEIKAPPYTELNKLIVYAHYSNSNIEITRTTYIGDIVTVSFGSNTGLNHGSYGAGLEFIYDPATTQSKATPHVAGIFAKLKILTGKSWSEIRTALRETASNHGVWDKCEGYGIVNYDLALKELRYKKPPRIMPEFIPKSRERIDK